MTVLSASVSYEVGTPISSGRFYTLIYEKLNELVEGPASHWGNRATHLSINFNVVFPDVGEADTPYKECPDTGPYIHWGNPDESKRGNSASFSCRWAADVGWLTEQPKGTGYYLYSLFDSTNDCHFYTSFGVAESVGVATLSITYSTDGDEEAIKICHPSARSARVSLLYRKGDGQIKAMMKNVAFSEKTETSVVFSLRNDFDFEPYRGFDLVGIKVSPDQSNTPVGYDWRVEVGRTRPLLPYSYVDLFNALYFGNEYLLEYDTYSRGLYKNVQYTKLGFNTDGYGKPYNPSLVHTVEVIFSKISPADDECFEPDEGETPLTMDGDDFIGWVTDDEITEEEKEERVGIFFPPESEPFMPPDFVLVEPDSGGGMIIVEPKPPAVDDIEPVLPLPHEPNEDLDCCRDIILSLNRLSASLESLNVVDAGGFNGLIESLQSMHVDIVNAIGVEQKRESYDMTFVDSLNYIASLLKIGDTSITEVLEDSLMSEVETDLKKGLADIVFERDNVNLIDYPVAMLTEPATTKKLKEF